MSKRPWFPFYTADFERKTKHLPAECVGAYIRLMMHYWDNNGILLTEPANLCRIMGIERRRYKKVMLQIGAFLLPQSSEFGDAYLLPRLQEELNRTITISKAKAESGRKGGLANAIAKRKQNPTHSHTHINNNNYWAEHDLKKEWAEFKKMRTSIKSPVNKTAENRIISKLTSLQAAGDDPKEILNRSTENCWKGVFPLKEESNGTTRKARSGTGTRPIQTPADRNAEAARRYFGESDGEVVAENV